MTQISQKSMRQLLDAMLFIENTATHIHGKQTEEEIFTTLNREFRKAGKYVSSILLLTPDRLHLRVAYASIANTRIRAAEKVTRLMMDNYLIRIRSTPLLRAILGDGETLHASAHDFTRALLPSGVAQVVLPILNITENAILTPLYREGERIGIFAISATDPFDLFAPSVKNFAIHIGRALETAAENRKRQQSAVLLGESEKRLWASEHSLREFSRKILKAREEEAKKISADLHDEMGSMAVSLGSNLEIADREIAEGRAGEALKSIRQTKAVLLSHVDRLRRLAVHLRPPNLEYVGLTGALRLLFAEFEKQTKLRIKFRIFGAEPSVDENAAIVLYRIAQEAINNTLRHAKAKTVAAQIHFAPAEIDLSLKDDGCGFDATRMIDPSFCTRIGLRGMKERAQLMDGIFQIDSQPGKGCRVRVRLPLDVLRGATRKTNIKEPS